MTDTQETQTDTQPSDDDPKGLRKQLAEAHQTIKQLRQKELDRAFGAVGLDPTTGLGKAIAKEYEGEASPEALAQYAKDEYGFEPQQATENPIAGQVVAGQAALDAAGQHAGSVPLPNETDELAAAEAEGNVGKAFAIKSNQMASWFGGKPSQ